MDDFKLDARRWHFLKDPWRYLSADAGDLQTEPLIRQFKTVKEILERMRGGRGVLLADDVGLGKTTVAALVAWIVACQNKRVRIYAPNDVLRRRWAEELERHVPMLHSLGGAYAENAHHGRIKQGRDRYLRAGHIQVTTHHALVQRKHPADCDLMIIDEAHRAKGEHSGLKQALRDFGGLAKRKLILTATPFSIDVAELQGLLRVVGATDLVAVAAYAKQLKELYSARVIHDTDAACDALVSAAKAAIDELQPYLIRHGIDDLSVAERKHFGAVDPAVWDIATRAASEDEVCLLLRMDRLLQLLPGKKGERRNDPRFHIGWQQVGTVLDLARNRAGEHSDNTVYWHIEQATSSLSARRADLHPKIASVCAAITPILDAGEKVLVFCHHRATASELLGALEQFRDAHNSSSTAPPAMVWRTAWVSLLSHQSTGELSPLVAPIIDWLCSPGIRRQIAGWIGDPAANPKDLAEQLAKEKPRNHGGGSLTIHGAAEALVKRLLDPQSKSTRALLTSIKRRSSNFGGKASHFPGRLDYGVRAMGAWTHDGPDEPPASLYTGEVDIVIEIFNSPFGPDVLVATDRLSEGVDLHRYCRHLIHYELDPSPVRIVQRNGRVRRVGSWAAQTGKPIRYAYPTFGGTRDEKAIDVMKQRINAFGLLLGGVPSLDDETDVGEHGSAAVVLRLAGKELKKLNRKLSV